MTLGNACIDAVSFLLAESQCASMYYECTKGMQSNMLHIPNTYDCSIR